MDDSVNGAGKNSRLERNSASALKEIVKVGAVLEEADEEESNAGHAEGRIQQQHAERKLD